MMKLLIFGATSAIAHETARCFAMQGAELLLIARNTEKLAANAADLKVYGAKSVDTLSADLNDLDSHLSLIEESIRRLGGLDAVLIAHGTLGEQKRSEADVQDMLREFTTNGLSYMTLLTHLANYFEQQRRGTICVISSVAGDRGRGSNYVYGSAKGAVTLFAGGVRSRLAKVGVNVVTIKPGFVDTPMTANLKKNLLYADPKSVGKRIHAAMLKGEDIVYAPFFWMFIMMIIRNIPERIFKKTKI
ncbi:MAG: SDR family oxidoreductase [Anaerolineae bacterium]|nr:SDR family oxidoreductase [Anaerolineae bacterium]